MRRSLRVVAASIPIGDVAGNVSRIASVLRWSADRDIDLVLTPEGGLSGYLEHGDQSDIDAGLAELRGEVRRCNVGLAVGICGEDPEVRAATNRLVLIDRCGVEVGAHRKMLLCRPGPGVDRPPPPEGELYLPGEIARVFRFEGVDIGLLICNDLWADPLYTTDANPQLMHDLTRRGAKLILHAANTGFGSGPTDRSLEDVELCRAFHEVSLRLHARAAGIPVVTTDVADGEGRYLSNSPVGILDGAGHWVSCGSAPGPLSVAAEVGV